MPKVTQSISLDFDDWELIAEIRGRYKAKNHSQAIHIILRQYQNLMEKQLKAEKPNKETSKIQQEIHPLLIGIPPLPDKYKMKVFR